MIRALGAKQRAEAPAGSEHSSLRTCVASRTLHPPEELIRFVLDPDNTVIPDLARKLPGRGAWLRCHRSVVSKALKNKDFIRAFRRKVTVPSDLVERIDALLVKRALELLSISNKAGLVACGSSKVNSWLEAGANGALVQAADASPDGLEKVARKYRAIREATGNAPAEVTILTIDELSLAIGRANVVHAALSEGDAATNFLASASRVEKYRAVEPEASAFKVAHQAIEDQPAAIRKTGQV